MSVFHPFSDFYYSSQNAVEQLCTVHDPKITRETSSRGPCDKTKLVVFIWQTSTFETQSHTLEPDFDPADIPKILSNKDLRHFTNHQASVLWWSPEKLLCVSFSLSAFFFTWFTCFLVWSFYQKKITQTTLNDIFLPPLSQTSVFFSPSAVILARRRPPPVSSTCNRRAAHHCRHLSGTELHPCVFSLSPFFRCSAEADQYGPFRISGPSSLAAFLVFR